MSDPNALTTLADVKNYLKVSDSQWDLILDMLISQVSDMTARHVGCALIQATYTAAKIDGNGLSLIYLPNWPVTSITSITLDGETLTADVDYVLYNSTGLLKKLYGVWTEGSQNIVVTYQAGYTLATIPYTIQAVVLNKIAKELQKAKGSLWGQTSRSAQGGSISFSVGLAFDSDEKAALSPFRRITVL